MERADERTAPEVRPPHKWGRDVLEHPLLTELRTFLGILSDSYAHFSPEFEGNLRWAEEVDPGRGITISLEYFDTTKRVIHCAFLNLAAVHLKLLDVFNACFKDGLQHDGGWLLLKTTAWTLAGELAAEFNPGEYCFPDGPMQAPETGEC
jgi:hypothetical protein